MTAGLALPAREKRDIPLDCITGRSPANCRPEADDGDVAELEASIAANGLIYPLLVSRVPGPKLRFWVDAGGRRLAALRRLVAAKKLAADAPIACEVIEVEERRARELSLAENIHKALHPVDQCAAFEAMMTAGMAEDEIAAHFAITVRQVRQRLKLTKLSPRVREAWRAGTLSTEAAQAMTIAASHEAQDALLESDGWLLHNPLMIRQKLRGEAVAGDSSEAIYVGLDAYVAAGGSLDENLFGDHPLVLDAALLKRLAREKMMAEGEAVLKAENLAFCMIAAEAEQAWCWPRVQPEFTPDEIKRQHELADADFDGVPDDDPEAFDEWSDALEAEGTAIEQRALERALTPEIRAKSGIFLDLTPDGALDITRGILQRSEPREAPGGSDTSRTSSGSSKREKPSDPIEAVADRRGVRDVLEATIAAALIRIVGQRPDLALLFAVARFGGTWQPMGLNPDFGLDPYGEGNRTGLLSGLKTKEFDHAVAICAKAPLADLTATFAQIVAGSIRLAPKAPLTALDALMSAFGRRGAPLRTAFTEALDAEAYFAAATRNAILAALEAMRVSPIDRKLKTPALAALAAEEAKYQAKTEGWLPHPLDKWAVAVEDGFEDEPSADDRPLAGAMAAAIDADVDKTKALDDWLLNHVVPHSDVVMAAGEAYESYKAATTPGHLGIQAFGQAVAARGITKRKTRAGYVYENVRYVAGA